MICGLRLRRQDNPLLALTLPIRPHMDTLDVVLARILRPPHRREVIPVPDALLFPGHGIAQGIALVGLLIRARVLAAC